MNIFVGKCSRAMCVLSHMKMDCFCSLYCSYHPFL